MNYFPFYVDPYRSAICLDDKRITRIYAESVFVLSWLQLLQLDEIGPYQKDGLPLNPRMPNALRDWLMDDFANTCWYIAWVRELRDECIFRFGEQRVAGYSSDAHYQRLNVLYRIADTGIDGPTSREHPKVWLNMARAEAKGLDYSHEPDAHKAYRDYVAYQWRYVDKRPCIWSYRDPPEFVIDDLPADFPKDLL